MKCRIEIITNSEEVEAKHELGLDIPEELEYVDCVISMKALGKMLYAYVTKGQIHIQMTSFRFISLDYTDELWSEIEKLNE